MPSAISDSSQSLFSFFFGIQIPAKFLLLFDCHEAHMFCDDCFQGLTSRYPSDSGIFNNVTPQDIIKFRTSNIRHAQVRIKVLLKCLYSTKCANNN